MKLIHEKDHPSGFKIILALKKNYREEAEISIEKDVRKGAQLEVNQDTCKLNLDPNAALLYLFNKSSDQQDHASRVSWLEWEQLLQEVVFPYVHLAFSDKEDKTTTQHLLETLKVLDASLPSKQSYFSDDFGPIDIALFSTLHLLLFKKKSLELLQKHQNIFDYVEFIKKNLLVAETLTSYYGQTQQPSEFSWAIKAPTRLLQEEFTWKLLRDALPSTQNSSPKPTVAEGNISSEALKTAEQEWNSEKEEPLKKKSHPILPVPGQKNIFITSALPYVNNVPHLGNIIGCVLSADCFARFCRIEGDNVLYLCGTDEYGTATETKAIAEGLTPKQVCDKYNAIHSEIYEWFDISFDYFGRTTTNSQTELAQSIFWDLEKKNLITRDSVEQLYCESCKKFLADRFVEGICPHPGCGYEDARGDQCDGCSKLVNATELIKPRCKLCSKSPILRSSKHLFLNLPVIEPSLKKWIEKSSPKWTSNAKNICDSWIRDGLKKRCITRDLTWGTPVPLEGYQEKVFYVWYDAPIGYISITKEYTKDWEQWWKNPSNVDYYEFMAKDNVPFHSVIFPACLLGTGQDWTKVTHLIATEYLNYEDGKFSKSRGVGVFGDQARDTGIPSDVWRFYLLYVRPEAQDSSFSWVDLQTKNNSELLNNLGNFVNRSLKFVSQFCKKQVPKASPKTADYEVMAAINAELQKFRVALQNCCLRDGIRHILSISKIGNQYIQEIEPFKLIKPDQSDEDKEKGFTCINIAVNIVGLIGIMIEPYMPQTSKTIFGFLNKPPTLTKLPTHLKQFLPAGHSISDPYPLVKKITDEEIEKLKTQFAGAAPVSDKPKSKQDQKSSKESTTPAEIPKETCDAKELEAMVTAQGGKVRELKTNKASKDEISAEVAVLLKLKERLAIAQGVDPSTLTKGNKKKSKK